MGKVLITGATGFIGRWLVSFFLKKGMEVMAQGSCKDTIDKLKFSLERNKNSECIEFWEQNFLKDKWNFPDFSDISAIIHCAAATKVREGTIESYDKYFTLNILATKTLAKKALEANTNHFIHLSSGQVFGIPPSFPITDNTPKKPINVYGWTKLMGEQVVHSLGILGLKYTIVRPFSVYGKGHDNIISIIMDKMINGKTITIYGDGTSKRAFLHVNDFCKAIDLIMNNIKCFNEEYNLLGSKEYSVNELVQLISKKLNKVPQIEQKEPLVNELTRNIADLSKMRALGFNPQETLEQFIEKDLIE